MRLVLYFFVIYLKQWFSTSVPHYIVFCYILLNVYILWAVNPDRHAWGRPTRCTLLLIIYFTQFVLDIFRKSNCSSSGGVLYKQPTVFYRNLHEESSRWHDTIDGMSTNRVVSATRLLLGYTVKYCKLPVQNSSWWWTITCSKHVEDKISEINYDEKCASCWSFSRFW